MINNYNCCTWTVFLVLLLLVGDVSKCVAFSIIDTSTTRTIAPGGRQLSNSFSKNKFIIPKDVSTSIQTQTRIGQKQQQQQQKQLILVLFSRRNDSIYTKRVGSTGGGQPGDIRSKRQERVGQLVSTELGRILHNGIIKGRDVEYLDNELRQRISIVKTDISPDLRQARVSVSIRADPSKVSSKFVTVSDNNDDNNNNNNNNNNNEESTTTTTTLTKTTSSSSSSSAVDKRRAYSWLVRNTKPLRHTLAQRMSHMKTCPTLQFVQVDVAAAVDIMYLIDRAVSGQQTKRSDLPVTGASDEIINEFFDNDDDDDDDDDDEFAWEDVNDEFFSKP